MVTDRATQWVVAVSFLKGRKVQFIVKWLTAIGFALTLAVSAQAETITPRDASQYVGNYVTVTGEVSQVSRSNGGTTFINFGGRFPNHVFYAVIFKNRASAFPGVFELQGRNVAITGEVSLYNGKPQIILSSPSQLEVQ
jgi:DNA/RNA endonuclease YhcR with UshA esterase domain